MLHGGKVHKLSAYEGLSVSIVNFDPMIAGWMGTGYKAMAGAGGFPADWANPYKVSLPSL